MNDNEALAVATRIYVRMRQHAGRVIDAVWMTQNPEYAREIVHLCRVQADPELNQLADRFEVVVFHRPAPPAPAFNPNASGMYPATPESERAVPVAAPNAPLSKYLKTLR